MRSSATAEWTHGLRAISLVSVGKLGTFRTLSGEEKLAAFEAAALLLVSRILVALVPLRFWRKHFGAIGGQAEGENPDPACARIAQVVRHAIKRAMRNAPLDYICLPQALAARWMLARRGVDSSLSIGVSQADADQPRFHAWLMSGGQWVTGDCNPADFAVLGPEPAN